jgi:hypothetical protein
VEAHGGTNRLGVPATGKPFAVRGVPVFELEGDRLRRIADYYNLLGVMAQVGLLQPEATPVV